MKKNAMKEIAKKPIKTLPIIEENVEKIDWKNSGFSISRNLLDMYVLKSVPSVFTW